MSAELSYRYYVTWSDFQETIPLSLFRTVHEGSSFPVDEQVWHRTDRVWTRTTRVSESMFRGGDVEKITLKAAQKFFPEAFLD